MKLKLKGFLLALCVAAAAVFAGCTQESDPNALTIKYFVGGYGSAWIENAKTAFEAAHSDTTVTLQKDPNLQTTASSLLNSKNPPDIIMTLGFNWQDGVRSGKIESLDDVYNAEMEKIDGGKVQLKDFISEDYRSYPWTKSSPLAAAEHAWVIPWTATSTSLAYNEDLLKKTVKAGEGFWAAPPTTEAELKQLAADVNATSAAGGYGAGVKVAPFIWPGRAVNWLTFIQINWWAQYQGLTGNFSGTEGNWYDFWDFADANVYKQTGLKESYRLLQDLFVDTAAKDYKNIPDNMGSKDTVEAEQDFIRGRAVMMPVGTWIENEMKDFFAADWAYPDIKSHLRMMTLPAIEGARATNLNNAQTGDVMLIPSGAKNKDMAKEFLKFLHSERQLVNFTKSNGVMRPFEYNPLTADPSYDWSVFQRDAIALYTENTNFFQFSNEKSPFFVFKNLDPFQPTMSTIFNDLLTGTAADTANNAFTYVSGKWTNWSNELGL
ncbi:MAG: hypothetical protein LBL66_05035 [Clostridiales bacterium]|jgi:N-acetylglucosamine transport system substrate-binding protein|nr:hypothetical protein [Clostridiales bacterium]